MGKAAIEQEKLRQAKARLRRIQHYEQVTHNASQTCRFFGVSRRQFYTQGLGGLKNLKTRSRKPHPATPPHLVALTLRIQAERQYGPFRIRFYLQRFHQVYVSVPTILKRHGVPRVAMKRYRSRPRRRPEFTEPDQSAGCPEVNGNVQRRHRTDGKEFYRRTTFRTPGGADRHTGPSGASTTTGILAGKTPRPECACELKISHRTGSPESDTRHIARQPKHRN